MTRHCEEGLNFFQTDVFKIEQLNNLTILYFSPSHKHVTFHREQLLDVNKLVFF